MNLPSAGSVNAFGRHVITSVSTAAAMLAMLKLMTPEQVQSMTDAVGQINDGVAKIVAGVGVLIPIGTAIFAALTASPIWQMFAVAKSVATPPEVKAAIVQNVPAVAAVTPSTGA